MNLKYFNQLGILLKHRSLNSRKYTDETVVEIKKLQNGWYSFEKPTLEEYINYNTLEDENLTDEEREELVCYYECDFPEDKYYFHIQWENGCLVINNRVIYTPYSNEEYAEDFKELFAYLQTADKAIDLSYRYKFGIIKRKELYDLIPTYRESYLSNKNFLDKDLEAALNRKIIPIRLKKSDYLKACLICYKANNCNEGEDFINSYTKNADGRDDDLLQLEDTEEAFDTWCKISHWGHPFEIMRGGNSTHISLYPIREDDKYYYLIEGKAWNRSMETLNAFVALSNAGYPVKLGNEEVLINRYKELDYVGILPVYMLYSYYNHEFEELFNIKVEDSFNWYSFGEDIEIEKLLPYVTIKAEGESSWQTL